MRRGDKALAYILLLVALVLMATSDETRNGGTPAQWAIFWAVVSLLGFGILRNIATPDEQPHRTKKHHRRVTRRDVKEYRRGR